MKTKSNFFNLFLTANLLILFMGNSVLAQEGDTTAASQETPKKDKRPVKDPFESNYILNNQTIIIPTAKTLEYVIQHRFGKLNSEDFDFLGMYAPSNIRMGLNYTFTDRIQVGIGSTKNNKLQDLNWKAALLRQTRSGSMPINITYFGNMAIDVRADIYPEFTNRLSYFHQLIIARKFHNRFSLQVAPSFTHFNMVDTLVKHNNIGISMSGRVKITDGMGIIFEYDHPLTQQDTTIINVKPNLTIGIEAVTSAHAFQIFVGTFDSILSQHNILYNTNDFLKKEVLIGFNITRLWNF